MPRPDPAGQQQRRSSFQATELVYPDAPNGPRFGELIWNIGTLSARTSLAERELDFSDVPEEWMTTIREVLMITAQPDHPEVVASGIVRRARPAAVDTMATDFRRLGIIARWAAERGLGGPATWTPSDAEALRDDLRAGRHRDGGHGLASSSVHHYVRLIKMLRAFGPMLTSGGLPFQPWGARSAANVASHVRPVENKTPPLRWETWAPAIAASWAFIDRFSSDILGAVAAAAVLPAQPRGPSGRHALGVVRAWLADGGKVPLHTGFGRSPGRLGEPNLKMVCRRLGINDNTFRPAHGRYSQDVVDLLRAMAQDTQAAQFGGLWTPAVTVTLDNGSEVPWINELGLGELELLVSILRASAYVLLASLSGMRDSEFQELTRNASTNADGLPALASVQYKGENSPDGRPRSWFGPPPVFRVLEVLAQLSQHPTHLFARSATNAGAYDPQRDIPRLIAFVNDDPASRPGRGHGLGLKPIHPTPAASINQTSLRRSFCVYAARYPGAEIGLGIQLGHAALRTTTGYASDGQQQVAQMLDKDRQDVAREQVAALILDASPVAGAPRGELTTMRAQVVADPSRADRIINAAGERYHLGIFNDCLWNKARSGCGPDGPKLAQGVCKGADCANALFRPGHLPLVTAHVERIDAFLDSGRGHPELLEGLRAQRALYSHVITDIHANAAHKDD